MTKPKRYTAYALTFIAAVACAGVAAPAQQQPSQQPTGNCIFVLGSDEEILRAESTIAISAEGEDVILVLTKGTGQNAPLYVFRDGKKTGPYAQLDQAMTAAYEGRKNVQSKRHECAAYNPGDPPEEACPVIDSAAGGKQVVQFKGKTFGPYMLVFKTQGTPDGGAAYYSASDNNKAWFGCSDGRVVSFGGLPIDFKFSPDGRNAAVIVQGKLSLDETNNLGKLPMEKMAAAFKEQEKKYVYTIDGKSFGPFESDFSEHSCWYPASCNDLYFRVGDDIFRNGVLLFKSETFDDCNFYPSPDGKKYAMYTYENIIFSDGQTSPSPLDIVAFQRAGKTVFRWITLEDNKKLVVYERAM